MKDSDVAHSEVVDDENDDDDEVPELVSVAQNLVLQTPPPAETNTTLATSQQTTTTATIATTNSSNPFKPCPVTILSGFLGSGKTTLIQHLLQSPDHGKRIAVIENEYGDGLLDSTTTTTATSSSTSATTTTTTTKDGLQRSIESLIAQDISSKQNNNNSLSDWIELPNGCLCCTVKDKLVTTLEHLITIKGDELDCILIEMSGMALPGPLASLFWLDDDADAVDVDTTSTTTSDETQSVSSSIHSRLRLDGIITVVDAYHIDSQLQTTFEAACQIAQADRILINKMDLIQSSSSSSSSTTTTTIQDISSTLRQLNPTALMQTTSYGHVPDWNWIFDIHSLDMDHRTLQHVEEVWNQTNTENDDDHHHDQQQEDEDIDFCTDADCQESHDHSHDHHNSHNHHLQKQPHARQMQHAHTSGVSTITLSHTGSVDLAKLNTWVASILWPHQDEADKVLRARLEQPQPDEPVFTKKDDDDVATTKSHDKNDNLTQQIFRIKGILSVRRSRNDLEDDTLWMDPITGLDRRYYIVQAVHDLWEIHPSQNEQFLWNDGSNSSSKGDDSDRCCKLIVIGRYMDMASLRTSFEECAVA